MGGNSFLYTILAVCFVALVVYTYGKQLRRQFINRGLIEKSLTLLKEKFGKPLPDYTMSDALREQFFEHFREDPMLTEAAKEILRHCGEEDASVRVHAEEDLSRHVAGNYRSAGNVGLINVKIDPYTRPEVAFAVLIHECMHYFLRHRDISFPEVYENEVLTDTAMIYFGFFDSIDRGYINVGYISYGAIKNIRKKLSVI